MELFRKDALKPLVREALKLKQPGARAELVDITRKCWDRVRRPFLPTPLAFPLLVHR